MADQCLYVVQKTGMRCSVKHKKGEMFCKRHGNLHALETELYGPIVPGLCMYREDNDVRCYTVCNGLFCDAHQLFINEAKTQHTIRESRKMLIKKEFESFVSQSPIPRWKEVVEKCVQRGQRNSIAYEIAFKFYKYKTGFTKKTIFNAYWTYAELDNVIPINPYILEFVQDNQNVHTTVVSKESNKITDKLLKYTEGKEYDPTNCMSFGWFLVMWTIDELDVKEVQLDMKHWFETPTCIKKNDYLYNRLLTGLFCYIVSKPEELQKELLKRTFEECVDSIGMCCQGHLTRLTNVLVGFDPDCIAQEKVSLQDKMAEIAALTVSVDEKKEQATKVMDELKIPTEERGAWLEALE
jgi:hypothetical protein